MPIEVDLVSTGTRNLIFYSSLNVCVCAHSWRETKKVIPILNNLTLPLRGNWQMSIVQCAQSRPSIWKPTESYVTTEHLLKTFITSWVTNSNTEILLPLNHNPFLLMNPIIRFPKALLAKGKFSWSGKKHTKAITKWWPILEVMGDNCDIILSMKGNLF